MQVLLAAGADARCINSAGETALHGAVTWGDFRAIPLLLQHDKSLLHMQDGAGDTALDIARRVGDLCAFDLLRAEAVGPILPQPSPTD